MTKKDALNKKINDIIFLKEKLKITSLRMRNEYDHLIGLLSKKAIEDNKPLYHDLVGKGSEIKIELEGEFKDIIHPFYFSMDSFLIDTRRIIEYGIRMMLFNFSQEENETNLNIKIQNFIDQVLEEYPGNIKKLYSEFKEKNENFISKIKPLKEWMIKISKFRTNAIHYFILNKSGKFRLIAKFSKDHHPENPKISGEISKLTFDEKLIEDFIKINMLNINEFLKHVSTLQVELNNKP